MDEATYWERVEARIGLAKRRFDLEMDAYRRRVPLPDCLVGFMVDCGLGLSHIGECRTRAA